MTTWEHASSKLGKINPATRAKAKEIFDAAQKAGHDAPWRGREGMSPDYSRHLAEVSISDALERAATFARGRTE